MGTTTAATESTAVTRNPSRLSVEAERMIEERKTRNLIAAKIAGLSWGAALDMESRRALADWGQQHGVDVTTEIHILGNRVYKNAEFYINRAQPYVRAGLIAIDLRYINADARLDAMAKNTDPEVAEQARKESNERAMLRVQFNVPEAAQSAVLCVVRFPKHGGSFPAAKWCGGGTRKGDPVGDGSPEATAATRAVRKALKMAVGYEPEIALTFGVDEDESLGEVEEVIHLSQHEQRALEAESKQKRIQAQVIAKPEYVDDAVATAPVLSPASRARAASQPDPMEEDPREEVDHEMGDEWIVEQDEAQHFTPSVAVSAPVADAIAARVTDGEMTLSDAITVTLSDNPGAFKSKGGDLLDSYSTEHLAQLRDWFEEKLKDGHRDDFALRVEAATLILDAREADQGKLELAPTAAPSEPVDVLPEPSAEVKQRVHAKAAAKRGTGMEQDEYVPASEHMDDPDQASVPF